METHFNFQSGGVESRHAYCSKVRLAGRAEVANEALTKPGKAGWATGEESKWSPPGQVFTEGLIAPVNCKSRSSARPALNPFPTSPTDPPSSRKGSDSGGPPPNRRVALGILSELPAFAALVALIVLLGCFLAAFSEASVTADELPHWQLGKSQSIEDTLFP